MIKWCCYIGEWKKVWIYVWSSTKNFKLQGLSSQVSFLTYMYVTSTLLITETQYYFVHLGSVNRGCAKQSFSTLCVTIQNNVVDIQQV